MSKAFNYILILILIYLLITQNKRVSQLVNTLISNSSKAIQNLQGGKL
jgi:hypothetical protein